MRRGHARTKHGRRERDPARMAFVSQQPCAVAVDPPSPAVERFLACAGYVQVDHAEKKSAAFMRTPDATVIALCRKHHENRTGQVGGYGVFGEMTTEQRRAWTDRQIDRTQALYAAQGDYA